MRTFADEYQNGTIEFLSTKPLGESKLISGKFFASLVLVIICILPTLLYVFTLGSLSDVANTLDRGGIIGSYIGLIFLAASFTAVGIFCSSLTDNQIVAFLIAVFVNFILYNAFEAISSIPSLSGGIDYYISQIGMQSHYDSISRGLIDTKDVVYFLSITILFLLATRLFLQKRKWA